MREGYGTCPVCNGTGLQALSAQELTQSWNTGRTHRACRNCGGQHQVGQASGQAKLRPDGEPCTHEYQSVTVARCYHKITCNVCSDMYHIDSGD